MFKITLGVAFLATSNQILSAMKGEMLQEK
jgi:hypothetical protein